MRDRQVGLVLQVRPVDRVQAPQAGQVERRREHVDVLRRSPRARSSAARARAAGSSARPRAAPPGCAGACESCSSSASSRSSAPSSISRSALRVTRKVWCSTISMPGKSWSRLAAITSSSGAKQRSSDERDEPRQQRRHLDAREVHAARAPGRAPAPRGSATGSRCTGTGGRSRPRAASGPGRSSRGTAAFSSSRCGRLELAPSAAPCTPAASSAGITSSANIARVALGQRHDLGRDRGQLLLRREAVGRARADAGRRLLLEAGDAHLEELVHVRWRRSRGTSPAPAAVALVLGERQHARVEVDRGQLAVQEAVSDAGCGAVEPMSRTAFMLVPPLHADPGGGPRAMAHDHPLRLSAAPSCLQTVASAVRQIYQRRSSFPARAQSAEVTRSGENR